MRETLKRFALTVAGISVLAGASSGIEDPVQAHERVRHRVLESIGSEGPSLESVRRALEREPDFGRLLEHFRLRSLRPLRNRDEAEDAFQETLLKTWRGRPSIFLQPHDEVVR